MHHNASQDAYISFELEHVCHNLLRDVCVTAALGLVLTAHMADESVRTECHCPRACLHYKIFLSYNTYNSYYYYKKHRKVLKGKKCSCRICFPLTRVADFDHRTFLRKGHVLCVILEALLCLNHLADFFKNYSLML